MYTCEHCYREFEEKDMIKNLGGRVSDSCRTCYDMIGKGGGYGDSTYSEDDINNWFEGRIERKLAFKAKQNE